MAEFLRPEARATLWRWRDVLAGAVVALLGAWWLMTFFSPVQWIGWAILGGGLLMTFAGLQRAVFRRGVDGPGIVQVIERRVAYFGPLTGGVMDLEDIVRLALEPEAYPAPHWILSDAKGRTVEIPITAQGAELLFDAFATLPGIRTTKMLDSLQRPPSRRVVIWSAPQPLLH